MTIKRSKIYLVECPVCNDVYSIEDDIDAAEQMRWKHYWKSPEGHVKEEDIMISRYVRENASE